MARVNVEISETWMRFARSPLGLAAIALSGVSVSFAPLFLFWAGQRGASLTSPTVLALFAVIFLVPLVFIRLGSRVLLAIRSNTSREPIPTGDD